MFNEVLERLEDRLFLGGVEGIGEIGQWLSIGFGDGFAGSFGEK